MLKISLTPGATIKMSLGRRQWPGSGHASRLILGKRLFLTTEIEGEVLPDAGVGETHKHTLKVLCFDADSGALGADGA